jgi:chromosomal replication initiation ATPase DnaA
LQVWNKCKKGFESSLSAEEYATWINPLEFDEIKDGNGVKTFYILAPNDFIKEHIRINLDSDFRDQLEMLQGLKSFQLFTSWRILTKY